MLAAAALAGSGQQLDLSSLDKLKDKAKESAVISLDADKLKMGAQFLSGDSPDEQKALQAITGLDAVYIRRFEFDAKGAYSQADVDVIRQQLKQPGWSQVMDVKDGEDRVELYLFSKNGSSRGMALVAAEAKEIAVINVVGSADLSALSKLKALRSLEQGTKKAAPKKDDDDN
jgi:hypothetical protein